MAAMCAIAMWFPPRLDSHLHDCNFALTTLDKQLTITSLLIFNLYSEDKFVHS